MKAKKSCKQVRDQKIWKKVRDDGAQGLLYSTAQMQVNGLTQVLALALKYLRTNTRVEKASARHEHNTTAHVMSLSRRAESFTS